MGVFLKEEKETLYKKPNNNVDKNVYFIIVNVINIVSRTFFLKL